MCATTSSPISLRQVSFSHNRQTPHDTQPSQPLNARSSPVQQNSAERPIGPATMVAAKAAAEAAGLFNEIRQLREGATLAAHCDAALSAQFERLQRKRMTEIRGRKASEVVRKESANSRRVAEKNLWIREDGRNGVCMVAVIVSSWRESAGRPRAIREYLTDCADLFAVVCAFGQWQRSAIRCRMESVLRTVEEEKELARLHADSMLAELQGQYLEVKSRYTEGVLKMSLGSMASSIEAVVFSAWQKWFGQILEERIRFAKTVEENASVVAVHAGMQLGVIMRNWREWVQEAERGRSVLKVMEATFRSNANRDETALKGRVLSKWREIASDAKRMNSRECRRTVLLGQREISMLQTLEKKQKESEALRECTVKAMMGEVRISSLQSALRDWKLQVECGIAERRLECVRLELEEQEVRRRGEHLARAHNVLKLRAAINNRCVPLCFAFWHGLPLPSEHDRLCEAGYTIDQVKGELELVRARVDEQVRIAALDLFATASSKQSALAQHNAIETWRMGAARRQVTSLREYACKQPMLVSILREDLEVMFDESLRMRSQGSAVVMGAFKAWRQGVCRRMFRVWKAAVTFLRRDSLWKTRDREFEAAIIAAQAEDRERMRHRTAVALQMNASADEKVLLSAVFQSWLSTVAESKSETALKQLQEQTAREMAGMRDTGEKRQKDGEAPMLGFMLKHLGGTPEPIPTKTVLKEWRAAAVQVKLQAAYAARRQAVSKDRWEHCEIIGNFVDTLAARYCFQCWFLGLYISRTERDRWDAEAAAAIRKADGNRLRATVMLRSWFLSESESLDIMDRCCAAWHGVASATSLQNSCDQLRGALRRRVDKARDETSLSRTDAGSTLAACFNTSQGRAHYMHLIRSVYFPTWRREMTLARSCRHTLGREEAGLAHLQELRQHSIFRQHRWATWAVTAQPRLRHHRLTLQILLAWHWHKTDAGARVVRETSNVRSIEASQNTLNGNCRRLCLLVLSMWRRVHREEIVLSLEEKVQRLEIRLARSHVGSESAALAGAFATPFSAMSSSGDEDLIDCSDDGSDDSYSEVKAGSGIKPSDHQTYTGTDFEPVATSSSPLRPSPVESPLASDIAILGGSATSPCDGAIAQVSVSFGFPAHSFSDSPPCPATEPAAGRTEPATVKDVVFSQPVPFDGAFATTSSQRSQLAMEENGFAPSGLDEFVARLRPFTFGLRHTTSRDAR